MSELSSFFLPLFSDLVTTTTTTTTSSSSSHSLLPYTRRRRRPITIRMAERNRKEKLVVILGATGAGKSRLSVDLATRLGAAEIINSDKIQVYKGLEITTNQITIPDRHGVPHHLLGTLTPQDDDQELSAADFRFAASNVVSDIISRGKLPIIAGGSNSFVHALLTERFDPKIDPFSSGSDQNSISRDLRYDCCFLWVHVSETVLHEYLLRRVDEMMDLGMFEELARFYDPVKSSTTRFGIRKAIGVPEFEAFFRMYPPEKGEWDREAYDKVVEEIKENTWTLAKKQIRKIERLRDEGGWEIKRVDATASFKEVLSLSSERSRRREIWEKQVLEPSVKIVNRVFGG